MLIIFLLLLFCSCCHFDEHESFKDTKIQIDHLTKEYDLLKLTVLPNSGYDRKDVESIYGVHIEYVNRIPPRSSYYVYKTGVNNISIKVTYDNNTIMGSSLYKAYEPPCLPGPISDEIRIEQLKNDIQLLREIYTNKYDNLKCAKWNCVQRDA